MSRKPTTAELDLALLSYPEMVARGRRLQAQAIAATVRQSFQFINRKLFGAKRSLEVPDRTLVSQSK